jgi:hypothetical protein
VKWFRCSRVLQFDGDCCLFHKGYDRGLGLFNNVRKSDEEDSFVHVRVKQRY